MFTPVLFVVAVVSLFPPTYAATPSVNCRSFMPTKVKNILHPQQQHLAFLRPTVHRESLKLTRFMATKVDNITEKQGRLNFVTNRMCPFAQKAWIALEYAGVPYDFTEISLYGSNGKPAWFRKLNPKGTVPVLVVDDQTVLTESNDIVDHLFSSISSQITDNYWTDHLLQNQLLPKGKQAVFSSKLTSDFKFVLREMDQNVVGPYLCGPKLTAMDCKVFPFLWRIEQEFGLAEVPKLNQWLDHCLTNETCFKTTLQSSWWWWW